MHPLERPIEKADVDVTKGLRSGRAADRGRTQRPDQTIERGLPPVLPVSFARRRIFDRQQLRVAGSQIGHGGAKGFRFCGSSDPTPRPPAARVKVCDCLLNFGALDASPEDAAELRVSV